MVIGDERGLQWYVMLCKDISKDTVASITGEETKLRCGGIVDCLGRIRPSLSCRKMAGVEGLSHVDLVIDKMRKRASLARLLGAMAPVDWSISNAFCPFNA